MSVGAEEYLETQVMTASPERLHLMVVDGALRFGRLACAALEAGDIGAMHIALSRSQACVIELISGLESDRNPELVSQLRGLLLYTHQNLVQADLERDVKKIQDALRVLSMHRDTWITLIERLQKEQSSMTTRAPTAKPHAMKVHAGDDYDSPTHSWEG